MNQLPDLIALASEATSLEELAVLEGEAIDRRDYAALDFIRAMMEALENND